MNRSSLYHRNISNTSASLKLYQAKRRKQLKQENARLKRLVGELHLERAVRTDVARGNF